MEFTSYPEQDQELNELFEVRSSRLYDRHGNITGTDMKRLLLGLSAVSRKNIRFLTKRKWKHNGIFHKGITSQAIDAYIRLCSIATADGWVHDFSHEDFTSIGICSDRSVYNLLSLLSEQGLIKVYGKKYSHFRDIKLLNTEVKGKERFLSLNRTFFQPDNQVSSFASEQVNDYETFRSLSVGPKCLLLYILYMEEQTADSFHFTYTGKITQLASYMGVKKSTVIHYIKQINDAFKRPLIHMETEPDEPVAISSSPYDNRVKYDMISLPSTWKRLTTAQNRSYGFWREFERWMKKHSFKEVSSRPSNLFDPESQLSSSEKLQLNRKHLHNTLYHALVEDGLDAGLVYKTLLKCIREHGYLDEIVVARLHNSLVPQTI